MAVTIYKELPEDITKTKLFYSYKNIRMYRHLQERDGMKYWVSILLLDNEKDMQTLFYKGKLLPCVDIRTFPTWNSAAHEIVLNVESYKLIPKLYRDAVRLNAIPEDTYVEWNETMTEYLIEEI